MSIIEQIDNSPLFKILESVIFEGPAKVAGIVGSAIAGIGNAFSSGGSNSLGSGAGFSLGNWFGGRGDDAPAMSQSRGIEEPSLAQTKQYDNVQDVSKAELGNLSPSFGGGKESGIGIGV